MTPEPEAWRRAFEGWWQHGPFHDKMAKEGFRAGFQSRDAEISELRGALERLRAAAIAVTDEYMCDDECDDAKLGGHIEQLLHDINALARHQPAETPTPKAEEQR
jgi:hypothetical protein